MKKFFEFPNKYMKYSLLLIMGIFVGWIFFHQSGKSTVVHDHNTEVTASTIWTCSMHPQIRMEEPGKCPICGMNLIPLAQTGSNSIDPDAIRLTQEAVMLAKVQTTIAAKKIPLSEIRLYGKIQSDERLIQSQTAHITGRIEKLAVNFTGETVKKGEALAVIYSPELITAQQELLETAKTKLSQPELYEAAKEKLSQLKLSEKQISALENSGTPVRNFEILSNTSGIVVSRKVNTGDYISAGTVLFEVADLSRVWVVFDAYESDLQSLTVGDKVSFTLQAMPGTYYAGKIVFIDPVIDPVMRVAKVRVETGNPSGNLKPEMFATGIVQSGPGLSQSSLIIPRTAVLWTGKRSIVYVKQPGTTDQVFKMREIELGPMVGEGYIVNGGLSEGEEIVTNGTFNVDAAAQLEGKPSMMNR
jgi:membrane fusion protein, copper/silver efflux system